MTENAFAQTPVADHRAIRSLIQERDKAWNAIDAKAYARLFTSDADHVSATGRSAESREGVVALLLDLRAGPIAGATVTNRVLKIRLLRPDVALVDTEYELAGLRRNPTQPVADHGRILFVMTKSEGRWSIAAIRGMPSLQPRR